ncbi:hypothetical protein [Streptomyces sp. NPDC094032]|uniref:hypothetical protein n=1 Tax=Streptomyces sp. NPDC094032 TaxID=3155308 RepID=UPI00331AB212
MRQRRRESPVYGDGDGYRDAESVRSMLRSWGQDMDPAESGILPGAEAAGRGYGTGLDVPHADAAAVVGAVVRLLGAPAGPGRRPRGLAELAALSGLPAERFAELRLLAQALVVDEHPSAPIWSAEERLEASSWVAVLIERRGDDGVAALVAELRRSR